MIQKNQGESLSSPRHADANPAPGFKASLRDEIAVHSIIRVALRGAGLPSVETSAAMAALPPGIVGALLYGSRARGDTTPESDIDILVLTNTIRASDRPGPVSVATYSGELLNSASGTLFGMHLKRDGIILYDTNGKLEHILEQLDPPDPDELDARLRRYCSVLQCEPSSDSHDLSGLVRVARYLLRTAIYNSALRSGRPSFSVRDLAHRFADPTLESLLSSHAEVQGPPSKPVLMELTKRLSIILDIRIDVSSDTLQALIVRNWVNDPGLSRLAMLALEHGDEPLDYASLPMVIL